MLTELQKKVIVVICVVSRFLSASVYSLQAPFFPNEAEQKQVTPSQYGLVFSIYEIVVLATAPVIGANIHRIGTKFGICCGLFIAAYACILFGFLSMVPSSITFLTLSIIIRIFEALGQASASVCSLTLLSTTFPDTANVKMAYTGTAFASGMVAGPAIGGALFAVGGFLLPFMCVGLFLLLCLAVAFTIFPTSSSATQSGAKGLTLFLLRKSGILVGIFNLFTCSFSLGFLAATLEPHLRKFNYSPSYTSLFFLITPAVFGLTNRFPAKAMDKNTDPRKLIIIGTIFKISAFCFIGPFPWIPINPNPYLVGVGLVFNGLANSCQIIPGFGQLMETSRKLRLPNNDGTNAVMAGFFQVSLSLGLSVGPLVGGTAMQLVDFRRGILTVILINVFLIIMCILSLRSDSRQAEDLELERQPLLQDSSVNSSEGDFIEQCFSNALEGIEDATSHSS